MSLVVLLAGGAYWLSLGDGGSGATAGVLPSRTATPTGTPVSTRVPKATTSAAVHAASSPPQAVLAKALAAATAAHWMHLQINDSVKLHTASFSDDSGPTSGTQDIVVDGAHTSVRLVDSDVYFTGDKAALLHYYGFTEAQAVRYVGQWLSLRPGGKAYDNVSGGITMASVLKEMALTGPLRMLPAVKRDGRLVFGISGKPVGSHMSSHATATMWIAADGSMLPVEYVAQDGQKRMDVVMSRWGHAVNVVAPDTAIPLYPKAAV